MTNRLFLIFISSTYNTASLPVSIDSRRKMHNSVDSRLNNCVSVCACTKAGYMQIMQPLHHLRLYISVTVKLCTHAKAYCIFRQFAINRSERTVSESSSLGPWDDTWYVLWRCHITAFVLLLTAITHGNLNHDSLLIRDTQSKFSNALFSH